MTLGRHRRVEDLNEGCVASLDHPCLVELLCEECDQDLLDPQVPRLSGKLQTDLRHLGKRYVEVAALCERTVERVVTVLHVR